jgi:peptide deformylase
MALLDILHFPDPRLRTKATEVEAVDEHVRKFVDDLFETMYAAPGIGLAATQVNIHRRIIVIDVSEEKNDPVTLINPVIYTRSGVEEMEEGCLSVPGVFEPVQRAAEIGVRALDRDGAEFDLQTGGLLAVCIQHEIDHLEGKLFVDYISSLKRQRLRKRLEKQKKQQEAERPVSAYR